MNCSFAESADGARDPAGGLRAGRAAMRRAAAAAGCAVAAGEAFGGRGGLDLAPVLCMRPSNLRASSPCPVAPGWHGRFV